jgi:hypothetical protein
LNVSKVLLVTGVGETAGAETAAFAYAKNSSATVVALQVVTSNLYHYGHVDLIATRPSKRDFLLYIRDEMVARAKTEAERLQHRAEGFGVDLEIKTVETEDVRKTLVDEATCGYTAVFMAPQKRKLFPLLERNLNKVMKKSAPCEVVVC